MRERIFSWLDNVPARAVLWAISKNRRGARLISRWSGEYGIFDRFEDAWKVAKRVRTAGHEHHAHAERLLWKPFRQSDYPVLFLLNAIQPKKVVDFGGSVGNLYYLYEPLIPVLRNTRWTVVELPEVVERGRAIARDRQVGNVVFTPELAGAGDAPDVLLASGSLHFWEGSVQEFFQRLGNLPDHVIINRTPTSTYPDYLLIQLDEVLAVPCMVRNRDRFVADFIGLGYDLIDTWSEPGATMRCLLLPAYSVRSYSSFYFRRPGAPGPIIPHQRDGRVVRSASPQVPEAAIS